MAELRYFVAGFGGQGILLLGQILAYAGMTEGREVTFLPSYGPEMRGGTANCTVILSDAPISCPIIDQATCLIAMNQPSLVRFESLVAPGGHVFINTSLIEKEVERTDVAVHRIPATDIARDLGDERAANIVMLGAVHRALPAVGRASLEGALRSVLPSSKAHLLDLNLAALDAWNGD